MRVLFVGLLVLCASVLLSTQSTSGDLGDGATILSLEHAWNQAEERRDIRALDELLAGSLAYTDWDGTFMTKQQFMDAVKSRPGQDLTLANEDEHVQMYADGDSAVVTGIYHEKGVDKGRAYARNGRFTDTWVKQGGSWVCVASQSTLITG
ncbi:MAG TPA: nuclear transport factor 2 family protein, partial [Candidatus Micrarchaeia archaeon]|nr:nuclear transport factor 2 family protein [Candidatus Micrarchaeia archaeon]